jgi:hypothetical protein
MGEIARRSQVQGDGNINLLREAACSAVNMDLYFRGTLSRPEDWCVAIRWCFFFFFFFFFKKRKK